MSEPPNPDSDSKAEDVSSDHTCSVASEAEAKGDWEKKYGDFFLFMKAGGCRDAFVHWKQCVDEAEKNKDNMANKCAEEYASLNKCMEAHSDYYNQQAVIELQEYSLEKELTHCAVQ